MLAGWAPAAGAAVATAPVFGSGMVLQRGRPVPVWGTAAPARTITVTYNGQTVSTTSGAGGQWRLTLAPMAARTAGASFTVAESGGNTQTFSNVVVGDVWLCSGQSNMGWPLDLCDRPGDISAASFPGIRHFSVPLANLGEPTSTLTGNWSVCSPSTAGGFSAVGFYFARAIYLDQDRTVPIGLITSSVGGTNIDPWLAPEGLLDIPVIHPLYDQQILPWGPFSLFNGMIYPLAPYPVKGAIWYQGENRETTSQSTDSYFLKQKALQQGWRRLWGMEEFPLYVVQLASWLGPAATATPDGLASWADTRQMQEMVLGLPSGGVASALDIGDADDIHPKNKLDVGERLALWALRDHYGRTSIVPSGPVLRDVAVSGSSLVCSFDFVGAGLMVGAKTDYLPTVEVVDGTLARFSVAGATGAWFAAEATIDGDQVIVSSPSVANPRKVAYAYWQNPAGANLYNRDGLPASPFRVDDVTAKHTVTATAGANGHISAEGATTYLQRRTALYTITPEEGFFIQDVLVDGVSVGAVKHYTFDPLYANRTIHATFAATAPEYRIEAAAAPGGDVEPAGITTVAQGGEAAFTIATTPGTLYTVHVDGHPMGARDRFTFSDVRADHAISASFSHTISAVAGFGGTLSDSGVSVVAHGGSKTYTFTPSVGYAILKVQVDGVNVGSPARYTFNDLPANRTLSVSFIGEVSGGSVPRQDGLLFSCLVDALPASGPINSWATYIPSGQSLPRIGSPTAELIDGRKFSRHDYDDGDGFNKGAYSSPIACDGASIVVTVKPMRNGVAAPWTSIVDFFYNKLSLGLRNDTGQICVWRNGNLQTSTATVPDGQTTVLSLVVQSNGTYKVWANGVEVMSVSGTSALTSIAPGTEGHMKNITVGRNWPDGWTTFNGYIGDLFVYTEALSVADRQALEQHSVGRLMSGAGTLRTITATAGVGGAILPGGDVEVEQGNSQAFEITPAQGYAIADVTVDGVTVGAVEDYTFEDVTVYHAIHATFTAQPAPPEFVGVALDAGNLTLTSTVAPRSQSRLWSSASLYLPFAEWTLVETRTADDSGTLISVVPVDPSDVQRFYRLTIEPAPLPQP